jgi:tripartite-type tricarboxylate transporter receptor subunit TctC
MNSSCVRFIFWLFLIVPVALHAQTYPSKPVRIIVPFPPGGSTDLVGRMVAAKISEAWGGRQAIVLEYRAGASGLIGTNAGVRAEPDGYVLTLGNNQTHATNASLYKLSFDMIKDVQPVARLVRTRHVVVVPVHSPYRTIADLISGGRAKRLNYASSSGGSASHMVSEMFSLETRIQGTHVPYKGASAAIADVIAGHVDFMTASFGSAASQVQGGKLRALMVSGEQRDPRLPDVPTFAEKGYESLAADTWVALFAPAGTPAPIVRQWSDALAEVMRQPDTRRKLESAGFDVWYTPVHEMERFHRSEVERWGKMVRAVGVSVQ